MVKSVIHHGYNSHGLVEIFFTAQGVKFLMSGVEAVHSHYTKIPQYFYTIKNAESGKYKTIPYSTLSTYVDFVSPVVSSIIKVKKR